MTSIAKRSLAEDLQSALSGIYRAAHRGPGITSALWDIATVMGEGPLRPDLQVAIAPGTIPQFLIETRANSFSDSRFFSKVHMRSWTPGAEGAKAQLVRLAERCLMEMGFTQEQPTKADKGAYSTLAAKPARIPLSMHEKIDRYEIIRSFLKSRCALRDGHRSG